MVQHVSSQTAWDSLEVKGVSRVVWVNSFLSTGRRGMRSIFLMKFLQAKWPHRALRHCHNCSLFQTNKEKHGGKTAKILKNADDMALGGQFTWFVYHDCSSVHLHKIRKSLNSAFVFSAVVARQLLCWIIKCKKCLLWWLLGKVL